MIINEIDKNLSLKEIYNVQEMNIPVELLGLPVRVKNSLVSAKDEFFKGISRPINMKLQRIFIQLGFAEQTGRGIPIIIQKYGEQAFDINENYVNVTIPFNKNVVRENKNQIEKKIEISRNDNVGKVLDYIKNNA